MRLANEVKKPADTRAFEECAKDDEEHDVGVADIDRRADDAVCRIEHTIDDGTQGEHEDPCLGRPRRSRTRR